MLALVVILLVVSVLLCVVVTGLLRSHADIVAALRTLGVGLGGPPAPAAGPPGPAAVPGWSPAGVHDIEGVDPAGDPVTVAVAGAPRTLLVFLSTACATCGDWWAALADPAAGAGLPPGVRTVVVTGGPEREDRATVARRAPDGPAVVMSSRAWSDYGVPGSPYVVLVDGGARCRRGQGGAGSWSEVVDLVTGAEDPGGVRPSPAPG